MKKMFFFSLVSLIASTSFSASPEVLKAVLSSDLVGAIQSIQKVEVVATYRCPNCFDVLISGTTPLGEGYIKVRTQQSIGGPLTIKYVEGSK